MLITLETFRKRYWDGLTVEGKKSILNDLAWERRMPAIRKRKETVQMHMLERERLRQLPVQFFSIFQEDLRSLEHSREV